jgi:hypothetical protein
MGKLLKIEVCKVVLQNLSSEAKKNSVVWVRERTIPTERPPLAGEVRANFCW